MASLDRKSAKEAFVAGLSGSSKLEIISLVSTLSASIVICECLKRHLPKQWLALEMLVVVFPHVLICTEALPLLQASAWSLALAVACLGQLLVVRTGRNRPAGSSLIADFAGQRKSFVSVFRGALMAATCICILAVDFHAFPRRYAKTEWYGTGYMDVGVGGVVFTAGLVSNRGGVLRPGTTGGGDDGDGAGEARTKERWRPKPLARRLYDGLRGAAACWLLGLARLVTTRAVNYQAHVGEYGVHWNFFSTIAVVALLGQAVALPPPLLAPAAVAVTAAHQLALSAGGLGPWVMASDRAPDLLSLNKEGVVSCTGFWALYLWGAALAHLTHATLQPAMGPLRTRVVQSRVRSQSQSQSQSRARQGSRPEASSLGAACTAGRLDGGGGDGVRKGEDASSAPGVLGPVAGADDADSVRAGGAEGAARGVGWVGAGELVAVVAPVLGWWVQMAALDSALWAAVVALEARVEPISRRSCNAAYILWIAAQFLAGMLPLALCQGLEVAVGAARSAAPDSDRGPGGEKDGGAGGAGRSGATAVGVAQPATSGARGWGPRVLLAINRNQLVVFLAANLMTGLVNMAVDTMQVPAWPARALLGAYISAVCGLALLLDSKAWKVKL